jgi:cellulose synthase/poly-beta-1,6-N-acetylglucosamine synthase-like glycosyltransferase
LLTVFEVLGFLLLATAGVYIVSTLLIFAGLHRIQAADNKETPSLSVIVPARNEAENIETSLSSILKQDYPGEKYEVVVIDDESEDSTYKVAKSILDKADGPGYKLIRLSSSNPQVTVESRYGQEAEIKPVQMQLSGKKRALTCGIETSTAEILAFTDADCRVPPTWLRRIANCFDPSVDLVAGFTFREHGASPLQRLYSLESLATATIAAGSIGLGYPITASASNLAYRRSLFDQLGGYGDISSHASGDDTLFLQKARRRGGLKASYMTSPDSFVTTGAPGSIGEITSQRRRRFSITPGFSPPLLLLSGVVLLFYTLLILSPVGILLAPRFFLVGISCLVAKYLADLLALHKATGIFKKRYLLKYLPLLELVYPPFFVYSALTSLVSPAEWKGRTS